LDGADSIPYRLCFSDSSIPEEKLRQVVVYGCIEHAETGQTTIIPVILGNKTLGSLAFRGTLLPHATMQALGNTVALALAQAQARDAGTRFTALSAVKCE
jgi:GAF domain-containing protein